MKGSVAVLVCDGQPDSSGDVFRKDGVEVPDGEVAVRMYAGLMDPGTLPLGRAKLYWREDVLFADLELLPAAMAENGLKVLYPSVEGVLVERRGQVIYKSTVRHINLSVTCNADKRIGTLWNQGVR